MLISAKIIKKTRVLHKCEGLCLKKIQIGDSALRLYGAARAGDPPYVVYLHLDCYKNGHWGHKKIDAAFQHHREILGEK